MTEMSPRDYFAAMPPLHTRRLTLRPGHIRDAEALFECTGDPEVARYVLWSPHRSLAECRSHLRFLNRQARGGEPCTYVIALRESNRAIGTIGFNAYADETRTAEIGYSIARAYWNRGLTTEALSALLSLCFERMRLHRVEAMHDTENPASGRVLQHCGMRFEGTLRGKVLNKGQWRDVCLWAMLDRDYSPSADILRR